MERGSWDLIESGISWLNFPANSGNNKAFSAAESPRQFHEPGSAVVIKIFCVISNFTFISVRKKILRPCHCGMEANVYIIVWV